ncbi:hypothetical protein P3L10_017894 [Capsicum annuum]
MKSARLKPPLLPRCCAQSVLDFPAESNSPPVSSDDESEFPAESDSPPVTIEAG